MHLAVAHLLSMSVIFCLLPSSIIDILVHVKFFISTSVNIMSESCEHSFTLPVYGTPVNNPTKPISPETRIPALHSAADSMCSSANFRAVLSDTSFVLFCVTDRQTDGQTSLLWWLYQRLHSCMCYHAGKNGRQKRGVDL